MEKKISWLSVPGIAVSGVLTLYSIYVLTSPIRRSESFQHFFTEGSLGAHFWSPLFLLLSAACIAYGVTTGYRFSRRTVAIVVSGVTVTEFRYGLDWSSMVILVPLAGLVFASVLASEVTDNDAEGATNTLLRSGSTGVFGIAALTAYTLLVTGLVVTAVSVLFIETNPLITGAHEPTPAIAFLTGSEQAYNEARIPFWGVAVAVVFVAVVTDTVQYRTIRWLTLITVVVNGGTLTFLWYPSLWTATVAAVGALLTVIVVALVLDERTETKIK